MEFRHLKRVGGEKASAPCQFGFSILSKWSASMSPPPYPPRAQPPSLVVQEFAYFSQTRCLHFSLTTQKCASGWRTSQENRQGDSKSPCVCHPRQEHPGNGVCVCSGNAVVSLFTTVLREGVGRNILCTKELCSALQAVFIADKFTTYGDPQLVISVGWFCGVD